MSVASAITLVLVYRILPFLTSYNITVRTEMKMREYIENKMLLGSIVMIFNNAETPIFID